MEKCRFCEAELNEGSTVCPVCGADNARVETTPAEETEIVERTDFPENAAPAEEVIPMEEAAPAEEVIPMEEAAPAGEAVPGEEEPTPVAEGAKVTPGKIAMVVAAIVLVIALIVGMLAGTFGMPAPGETTPVETQTVTEPVATVPADGNPDDETCKGTYTVTDEEVKAAADTVVATIGDHQLTNGELQVFYWMQIQSFLSSEYGYYMMYYGVLDATQPLDTQVSFENSSITWQQFFLKEALNTWQNYLALSEQAGIAGMELSAENQAYLDNIEATLAESATYFGVETVEELLYRNMGAGASLEDYVSFQEMLLRGNLYYDAEYEKLTPSQEELEAFFDEHAENYESAGVNKEDKYVDVRHILLIPTESTTDESGKTVYTEEAWAACETAAQELLDQWKAGEATEDSFAALATEKTEDPGSKSNGGLYEGVYKGQMVAPFENWCFDESRQTGDTGLVKTDYGYHIMYWVGSEPVWVSYARQDYMQEKINQVLLVLTEQYPMEVDYSAIKLGFVDMAAG